MAKQVTRTEQVNFRQTPQPMRGLRVRDYSPLTGEIISVAFHFPAGCNALVRVAFGAGANQIYPNAGFLALNDATPVFGNLKEPINKGDELWCIIENADIINPHTVSVMVDTRGVE